jgi:divalent metal cation (Fe/Co/Zn/Cd) transporter
MSFEEGTGRGTLTHGCGCAGTSGEMSRQIMRLQLVTLIWMVVECALALFSAWRAQSPVLLAFGADSLIELLSALVVTLAGLVLNAVLDIRWIDPAAALVAVPVICLEGKKAFEGDKCC